MGWYADANLSIAAPTTFQGAQTVYAFWTGMPGGTGFYYGHYPQKKVTDYGLKAKIKDYGVSKGGNDYEYEGKRYRKVSQSNTQYDFYSFDWIRWDYDDLGDNRYLLTSHAALDYRQMFENIPSQYYTYTQKISYIQDFTNSDLHQWLNSEYAYGFLQGVFTEEEKANVESPVSVPSYNGNWEWKHITDWCYETTEYCQTQGGYYDKIVGRDIPGDDKGTDAFPYWFRTYAPRNQAEENQGKEPLLYYYRSAAPLGSNAVEYRSDVDKYQGVRPQLTVNLNEMGTRTLHFNTGEGSPVADVTTRVKNLATTKVNLPVEEPERDEYVFEGWYKEPAYINKVENFYEFGKEEMEATLYAKWRYDTTVYYNDVTYHLNGGTKAASTPSQFASDVTIAQQLNGKDPTYDRYHQFMGWYLDEALTQPLPDTLKTRKPIDLYAKWAELDPLDIDFVYNDLGDGTFEVAAKSDVVFGDTLTIPAAKKDGSPIVKVAERGFRNHSEIKAVVLPDAIVEIGTSAFENCKVASFTAGSGLAKIGDYAFANCSFVNVTMLDNVEYRIGVYYGNASLITCVMPEAMKEIPAYFFNGCTLLSNLTLPTVIEKIGAHAFYRAFVAEIHLTSALAELDASAFQNANIGKLYWEGDFDEILTSAANLFAGATLGEFHLGGDVKKLPSNMTLPQTKAYLDGGLTAWCNVSNANTLLQNATDIYFAGAKLSGSIEIGDGPTAIPGYTFKNATIDSLTLPASVTSVNSTAFSGATIKGLTAPNTNVVNNLSQSQKQALEKLTILDYNTHLTYFNANFTNLKEINLLSTSATSYSKVRVTLGFIGASDGKLEKVYVGLGNFDLTEGCLSGHLNLSEVTVPYYGTYNRPGSYNLFSNATSPAQNLKKLTILGGIVYGNNPSSTYHRAVAGLEEVVIGEGVTEIQSYAFANYAGLKKVTFQGNALTTIGNYAFYNTGMTSFVLPASITNCGEDLFKDCAGMKTLSVASGNTRYVSPEGSNCIIDSTQNIVVVRIPTSVIPDTVTVASSGFYRDINEDTFAVPSRMTKISSNAFDGATIRILDLSANPDLVIDNGALANINGLEKVILPSLGKTFGSFFSSGDPGLTTIRSVEIKGGTSLPANAFANLEQLTEIVLPDTLETLPEYAFKNCTGLTGAMSFPAVTNVGDYAFYHCGLTEVNLPEATYIGYYCFQKSTNLVTVTFPKATTLKKNCLANCTNLGVITIPKGMAGFSEYSYILEGSKAVGIIIEDGTTVLMTTLLYECEVEWIYIPYSVKSEKITGTYNNNYGSATKGTIGKVYYGGSNTGSFTSMLDGKDSLGNPNFADNSKSVYKAATLYLNRTSSGSGGWHWVDGLPVEW
ncbi:MAG: leucine-rich repeat protein [Bacilli bacterium]|nr:leucine-rich repeat protein [Bacilli bacterium]